MPLPTARYRRWKWGRAYFQKLQITDDGPATRRLRCARERAGELGELGSGVVLENTTPDDQPQKSQDRRDGTADRSGCCGTLVLLLHGGQDNDADDQAGGGKRDIQPVECAKARE